MMLPRFPGWKLKKPEESTGVEGIRVDWIYPNPNQPRKEFSEQYINELAQSIRTYGVMQPITVRRFQDRYQLIAGERRLRAAKKAGLTVIPALILEVDDEASSAMALIENILREDLNFFEEAEGIRRLMDLYGLTQEQVAQKLCKTQSTIANKLRILRLSDKIKETIIKYQLTERHARALLKLKSEEDRRKVVCYVIKHNLNVKQTEELIEKCLRETERKKRRRMVFRDMRIFTNTINHALQMMKESGVEATSQTSETEEYIQFIIHIPKPAPSPQDVSRETRPA